MLIERFIKPLLYQYIFNIKYIFYLLFTRGIIYSPKLMQVSKNLFITGFIRSYKFIVWRCLHENKNIYYLHIPLPLFILLKCKDNEIITLEKKIIIGQLLLILQINISSSIQSTYESVAYIDDKLERILLPQVLYAGMNW